MGGNQETTNIGTEATDLELMHAELLRAYTDGIARSGDVPQPLAQHLFGQFFPRNLEETLTYRGASTVLKDMQWAGRFSRLTHTLQEKWGVDLWRLPSIRKSLIPMAPLQERILEVWNGFFLTTSTGSPAIAFIEEMERLVGKATIGEVVSVNQHAIRGKARSVLSASGTDRLDLLNGVAHMNRYFNRKKKTVDQSLGYRLFAPFYWMMDAKDSTPHGVASGILALRACERLEAVFNAMKERKIDAWNVLVTNRINLATVEGLLIALFHSQASHPLKLIENLHQTFVTETLEADDIKKRLRFFLGLPDPA